MRERERIDGDGGNQPKLYITCNGIIGLAKLIKILGNHKASIKTTCQVCLIGLHWVLRCNKPKVGNQQERIERNSFLNPVGQSPNTRYLIIKNRGPWAEDLWKTILGSLYLRGEWGKRVLERLCGQIDSTRQTKQAWDRSREQRECTSSSGNWQQDYKVDSCTSQ